MKTVLRLGLVLLLLSGNLRAQAKAPFQFNARASDHENQWVVLPNESPDDKYMFAFLYVDPQAGWTFQYGGNFAVKKNGRLKLLPNEMEKAKAMVKVRLQGDMPVAPLTAAQIKDLGLSDPPDWLVYYKDKATPAGHGINWGRAYNHIGACEKALTYLEPAYRDDPDDEKLLFELSYAYNALQRLDDSRRVLEQAVQKHPKAFYVRREYAYLFTQSGEWQKAISEYRLCLEICPPDKPNEKAELAMNLAQSLAQAGAKDEAREWFGKAEAWAPKGSAVADYFKRLRSK